MYLDKLIVLVLSISLSFPIFSQHKHSPEFDTRHKNIYVEFLGSHILLGVNFDMRLNKGQMDGIGLRGGIGGLHVSVEDGDDEADLGLVTFPLEFNHLIGKRRSSFETGIGILPAYATISGEGEFTDYEYIEAEGFGIAGAFLTLGYRLQPLNNGFMLQINWNPLILRNSGFRVGWFGLSLGMGFK